MLILSSLYNGIFKQGSILGFGFPFAVFLLLAFPSTSYARDMFTVIVLTSIWKDHQHLKEGLQHIFKSPTIWVGIALVAYVSLTTLWSQQPFIRSPGEQIRNGVTVLLFWFSACLYFYKDDGATKKLFWMMGLGLVGNLLGSWVIGQDLIQYNRLKGYGILFHPILLSSVAVIQIAIGLHLNTASLYEKLATIGMLGITTAIAALSVSRGPILALQAVFIIWMIYTPHIKIPHKIAISVIAVVCASTIAYTTGVIEVLAERGTSNRPIIWENTLAYARDHFWLGRGWINDFSQSVGNRELQEVIGYTIQHPHNLLISALYYGGIVGLLIHALYLGSNTLEAIKSRNHSLTFSLLAAVLLLTVTDTHSAVSRRDFMLLILWLPSALIIMTNLTGLNDSHNEISPNK